MAFEITNPPKDPEINKVVKRLSAALEDPTTWENFGMYLLETEDNNVVKLIDHKFHGDLVKRCKGLLDEWKGNAEVSTYRWEKVIGALRKVNLNRHASELEEALSRGSGKVDRPNNTSTSPVGKKRKSSERDFEADWKDETDRKPVPETDEEKLKQQFIDQVKPIIKDGEQLDDLKSQQLQVLVQTAKPIEFHACMLQMKRDCGVSKYEVKDHKGNTSYYYVGKWSDREIPVVIILTDTGSDGIHGSCNETKKALCWLPNLRYIFSAGFCGGIKSKASMLGKVVVSKAIQDYNTRKDQDDAIVNCGPRFECKDGEFYRFIYQPANTPENTAFGLVLSANEVVAGVNTKNKLLQACPDAEVVEMEGHGIARACTAEKVDVEFLVVKGISDCADQKKDDYWQPQAALNAAKALCKAMAGFFGSTSKSSSVTTTPEVITSMTDNGQDCGSGTSIAEKVQETTQRQTRSQGAYQKQGGSKRQDRRLKQGPYYRDGQNRKIKPKGRGT